MTSFTLTGGADAATANICEEGADAGDIRFVVKAAAGATVHLWFGESGVRTDDGSTWYVELSSGTMLQMTIAGR